MRFDVRTLPTRRQVLAGAAALALAPMIPDATFAQSTTAPAPAKAKRFKVAGDDLYLNNRQKVKAFTVAKKARLDGVAVDMGRMPGGKDYVNELSKPEVRDQFLNASRETGVEIAALAFWALYAWVFPNLAKANEIADNWIETLVQMNVRLGLMPLMTKDGTLREPDHAEVWQKTVDIFKRIAPAAERAGVILGVESNLDADGYKRFLDAVGSPNVRAFYNPGVGLENKFDVYKDIKDLGKDRIAALHLEQGSVPPENFEHRLGDGLIDFMKLREAVLEIEWGGWMTIARSRLKGTTSPDTNMAANAQFVREIFPE